MEEAVILIKVTITITMHRVRHLSIRPIRMQAVPPPTLTEEMLITTIITEATPGPMAQTLVELLSWISTK